MGMRQDLNDIMELCVRDAGTESSCSCLMLEKIKSLCYFAFNPLLKNKLEEWTMALIYQRHPSASCKNIPPF
jgi:hypothetical protein